MNYEEITDRYIFPAAILPDEFADGRNYSLHAQFYVPKDQNEIRKATGKIIPSI